MKKKISVVLPTYNEKENIIELIKDLYTHIGEDLEEIIVVDDNSPDKTWKYVEEIMKSRKQIKLIKRINEKGLPSAIATGILNSKGNIIVWLDCDFSHPLHLIKKMAAFIPEYDVVCASRYVKGGNDKRQFSRVLPSKILNIFGNIVLGLNIKDLTSGFYAVKKEVFDTVSIKPDGYAEYCIKFAYDASKQGYKIKEIPYTFIDRKKGSSKSYKTFINFLKNGYLCVKEIVKLRLG